MVENKNYFHQLLHGSGIVFSIGLFGFVLSFIYKLLAARHFGSADFGIYSLAETILGIAVLLITLGIPEGIVRYVPHYLYGKKFKELNGYIRFAFIVPFLFSIIIAVLVFVFSSSLASFFNFPPVFISVLQIVALILPFRIINNVLRKFFVSRKKVLFQQIAYNVIEKVIPLIGIVIIMWYDLPLLWLMYFLFTSIVIAALYCIITYKKEISFPSSKRKIYKWSSWMKFSLPLFFSGLFAYFIGWSDNLIIGKYLTPDQLGIYAVAFSLASFLLFFRNSFVPLFIPLAAEAKAKNKHSHVSSLFRKSSSWIFGLTLPVSLIIIFYSSELLQFIYGSEYVLGASSLLIITLGVLCSSWFGLNKEILVLHKRTSFIFIVNASLAIANILANIYLIPLLGILGAAIASAFSLIVGNIVFFLAANNFEKLSFDWFTNIKFIISGVLAILCVSLFSFITLPLLWLFVISGITFSIVYVLFLLLFKTFKKEDLEIISLLERKTGLNLSLLKKIVIKFY